MGGKGMFSANQKESLSLGAERGSCIGYRPSHKHHQAESMLVAYQEDHWS